MLTYLLFHLLFIVPPIVALWGVLRNAGIRTVEWAGIATIAVIAFLYATPWDNYLVANNIWYYGNDRVLGTIGAVPVEEYLFFVLQPILTGMWLIWVQRRMKLRLDPPGSLHAGFWAAGGFIALTLTSVALLVNNVESATYLALILVWASPIMALHYAVGGTELRARWRTLLWGIIPPTLYLSFVDALAIADRIWTITPATSTGWHIGNLPIEEALFFLVTNMMIVQGVLLFVWVADAPALRAWFQERALGREGTIQPEKESSAVKRS